MWILLVLAVLRPDELAGRRLFREGVGESAVSATVGRAAVLPGSAVPCANCHGLDGRGRREGAVLPPDIRWSELAKPWGHAHGARKHGAFDDASLARLVRDGVDPAGNRLDPTMPRYTFTPADQRHLLAYLKVLESEDDPGVTPDTVRLGTVQPLTGRLAKLGATVRDVLAARMAEVNADGGIHGRRLELVTEAEAPFDTTFVLVAPLAGSALESQAHERRVPVVGPLAPGPDDVPAEVFRLHGGRRSEAQALALANGCPPVTPPAAAALVAKACGTTGARGGATVLWLGEASDFPGFFARTTAERVLVPGSLLGAGLPDLSAGHAKLFLAVPRLPSGLDPRARALVSRIAAKVPGMTAAAAPSFEALEALELTLEALRRTGRDLRRERFRHELEGISRWESGFGPPLSFAPVRRLGTRGAYVVEVDRATRTFRPEGPFQETPE